MQAESALVGPLAPTPPTPPGRPHQSAAAAPRSERKRRGSSSSVGTTKRQSPKPLRHYVHLLVGVHESQAEAKDAYRRLPLKVRLPVRYERNVNGMGKCKTWLAVSRPYSTRVSAVVASRKFASFAGDGAVRVFQAAA